MKKKVFRKKYSKKQIVEEMIKQTGAKTIEVTKIDKIKDYRKESKKSDK